MDMQPAKSITQPTDELRYIDIGANLIDSCFRGIMYGKKEFEDDFEDILERSRSVGMKKILVTVGSLHEFDAAYKIALEHPGEIYITCGVHPTRSKELKNLGNYNKIKEWIKSYSYKTHKDGVIAAYGEFGLDYDRLHFSDKETQKVAFSKQLELAKETKLPLFLHCRSAIEDFLQIMEPHKSWINEVGGVCHCFTGSKEDAKKILDFGLDIGLTGLSFKEHGYKEMIDAIPLNRLHLETDAPYCSLRPSFAGYSHIPDEMKKHFRFVDKSKYGGLTKEDRLKTMVKGRNEPAYIEVVASCVASAKGVTVKEVADAVYSNTMKLYFTN